MKGDFTVTILLTVLQVIACLGLIATVLLQSGKSAGLSGAITGGAETFFGKKGMDDKFATWSKVFAVAFMVLTFILAVLGYHNVYKALTAVSAFFLYIGFYIAISIKQNA